MIRVAIQGIAGSFHDEAAHAILPNEKVECLPNETFSQVFSSVQSQQADYGIVAVENSLHGSINAVYRELAKTNLTISAEIYLKIEQFLIGTPSSKLNSINKVLSQLPALSQCHGWLEANLPKATRQETNDTAASVKQVIDEGASKHAAIAGRQAAKLYGGKILAGPINDDPHNYTRFFVLSNNKKTARNANRTSIILTEEDGDKIGALYEVLEGFKKLGINLSKLDSHPVAGKNRRYAFYIDFDASIESKEGGQVIGQLESLGWNVNILGSYVASVLPV